MSGMKTASWNGLVSFSGTRRIVDLALTSTPVQESPAVGATEIQDNGTLNDRGSLRLRTSPPTVTAKVLNFRKQPRKVATTLSVKLRVVGAKAVLATSARCDQAPSSCSAR
jgi:hypothetical protein